MSLNGLDHRDPVKDLANQSAIRIDPDRVDGSASLGIGEQHVTEARGRDFMRHGHGKPREIAQVPHTRDDYREVFGGDLQGHPEGIDTPLIEQGVRGDGQRLRPVLALMGEVAPEACRGADRRATLRHGDLLWRYGWRRGMPFSPPG